MVLTEDDITKFQALFQKDIGKAISREDAYEKGIKLLRLCAPLL